MPLNRLTEDQINDFQEVGNIGAGNAASRLSDLIHHPCTINIPEVRYLNPEEVKTTFETESAFAVAILIKVMGDIPAVMLVIMKRIYAHKVVEHMTRASGMITGKDFSFTAKVALKQLGELLTKSFSDSIAQFLRTKAKFAMPEIIIDTWTMTIDTVLQRKLADDGYESPKVRLAGHGRKSESHPGDFIDSVKSRKAPCAPIEVGMRSDTLCQLSDIAVRLGRKLRWDPAAERFVGDATANRLLTSYPLRSPWRV